MMTRFDRFKEIFGLEYVPRPGISWWEEECVTFTIRHFSGYVETKIVQADRADDVFRYYSRLYDEGKIKSFEVKR